MSVYGFLYKQILNFGQPKIFIKMMMAGKDFELGKPDDHDKLEQW